MSVARGLMKRADQVLAELVVDADLAADRAVDLREQRRRDVGERDAAQERRRGESGRVADDAATDGDDRACAVGACANQRFVDAGDRLQVLEALAVGDEDRLRDPKGSPDLVAVEAPDRGARDDEAPSADVLRVEQRRGPVDEPVANPDRRYLRAGLHIDPDRFARTQVTGHKSQVTSHKRAKRARKHCLPITCAAGTSTGQRPCARRAQETAPTNHARCGVSRAQRAWLVG